MVISKPFISLMIALVLGLVLGGAPSLALAAKDNTSKCGGNNEAKCSTTSATRKDGPKNCPSGSFFDLVDGGTCWSCPSGYNRTSAHVKKKNACRKPASEVFHKAIKTRKNTKIGQGCPSGQFWDVKGGKGLLGACYKCKGGYKRTAYKVDHKKSCAKKINAIDSSATPKGKFACPSGQFFDLRNGGECWSCPKDYDRNLNPVDDKKACTINASKVCDSGNIAYGPNCFKKLDCGKKNGRPCTIGERIPSCNDGLSEDFSTHTCVKTEPGKSPFLGGLKSLLKETSTKIKQDCRDNTNLYEQFGKLATGKKPDPSCVPYMQAGFTCAPISLAGELLDVIESGEAIVDTAEDVFSGKFKLKLDAKKTLKELERRFVSSDCANTLPNNLGFSQATYGGPSNGLICDTDYFYDPVRGGSCWKCDAGTERSMFESVESKKACQIPNTTAIAALCSVAKFITGEKMDKETQIKKQCVEDLLKKEPWERIVKDTGDSISQKKVCEGTGESLAKIAMQMKLMKMAKEKAKKIKESASSGSGGGGNRFYKYAKEKFDKKWVAEIGMPETAFKAKWRRRAAIAMSFKKIFSVLTKVDKTFEPLLEEASEKFIDALDKEMDNTCPDL